jgi:hypothetical protein
LEQRPGPHRSQSLHKHPIQHRLDSTRCQS